MPNEAQRLDRRRFLKQATAAGLVLAAHRHLGSTPAANENTAAEAGSRIVSLRLRTAEPLAKMKVFYQAKLGLPVLEETAASLTIGGGGTPITFVPAGPRPGTPFYHFAFNIPENKLLRARDWQAERTELIPVPSELRDPDYPDDVVHFRNWNAHSVFFLDPAGNIVEYIARHDLGNSAEGPFTESDILYASEIAFVADDVLAVASGIRQAFDLPQYRGGGEQFMALGDERGLLLVFKRGRKLSLADPKPKLADVFPTDAGIRAGPPRRHSVAEYPYEISAS